MPQKRQATEEEQAILVRSLGLRLPARHRIEPHVHEWSQLVYATEGVMTVTTPAGSWVVPPQRAAWIPAGFEHSVATTGRVRMRTLYLRPDLASELPGECCVVGVAPLLRELILEVLEAGMLRQSVPQEARLAAVLADQIARRQEAPLQLMLPRDKRALRVVERVRADLSRTVTITEAACGSGASVRTLERQFVSETGLTFGRWLQRARALHALERLAAGDSVTEAGLAVGYGSTSAFIAMFRRVLGRTPGSYFTSRPST
jgi:AraC-like DNA-binding protein